jgi:hypothetical protein
VERIQRGSWRRHQGDAPLHPIHITILGHGLHDSCPISPACRMSPRPRHRRRLSGSRGGIHLIVEVRGFTEWSTSHLQSTPSWLSVPRDVDPSPMTPAYDKETPP